MPFPIVTAWLAIFLSVYVAYFILKIAGLRRSERVELETGNSDKLTRLVRSHGNLVETAPLYLILLAMLELSGANIYATAILAIIFVISRIMHPIGLSGKEGTFKFRVYGMFLTLSAYIITSIYLAFMLIAQII